MGATPQQAYNMKLHIHKIVQCAFKPVHFCVCNSLHGMVETLDPSLFRSLKIYCACSIISSSHILKHGLNIHTYK